MNKNRYNYMKIKTNKNKLNIITKKTRIRVNGSSYVTSIPNFIKELYDINSDNYIIWEYDPNSNELSIKLQ